MSIKRFIHLLMLAAIIPAHALALTVGVEFNYYEPADQDVVLGSAVNLVPTDNDQLEFDNKLGYRLFAHSTNWRFSWLHLEPDADFAGGARGGDYYVALDHPAATYGPYDSIAADGEIELDVIDLDYLIPINTSGPASLMATAGIRYAKYDNTISVRYDAGNQVINRDTENTMFGLRGGLEGRVPLGIADNFSLAGYMAVSILSGESDFSHNESFGGLERNLSWDSTIPVFEAGIGVEYKLKLAEQVWRLSLGYDLLRFEDVATTQSFTDSSSLGSQVEQGSEAGFAGWNIGVGVTF